MALSMRSIHKLPTWPRHGPLTRTSQLPSLLIKRSSQTCARPGNVHAPIPSPSRLVTADGPASYHQSVSTHTDPLKSLSRQPPRGSFHRSYNNNSYDDPPNEPSFWARNKGVLVTSGVTGLCLGTYYLQWTASSPAAVSNNVLSRFISRNLINSPENVNEGRWWVLFSCSIAHSSPTHLLFNIVSMWGFVRGSVTLFGVPLFIWAWLFTSASCSAAQNYWQEQKKNLRRDFEHRPWQKKGEDYTFLGIRISRERAAAISSLHDGEAEPRFGGSVGASGAICGLAGIFVCYVPRLPMQLLFFLPMPLWVGELALTVGSGYCMATGSAPSVGHAGHLGGTAAGIAYYYALVRPWLRRGIRI